MSAVLDTPLYREPVEFRAVEAPGPLAISDRGDGLYVVANDTANHVEFRGFFGSYGPEVFAAAPELADALKPFVALNSSEETITITVRTADVARARAVLAKVEGVAS